MTSALLFSLFLGLTFCPYILTVATSGRLIIKYFYILEFSNKIKKKKPFTYAYNESPVYPAHARNLITPFLVLLMNFGYMYCRIHRQYKLYRTCSVFFASKGNLFDVYLVRMDGCAG